MRDCVVITDENGERTIDMDPVNDFRHAVDNGEISTELELLQKMSRDQLRFALMEFVGRWKANDRLIRFLHTEKGRESIDKVRELQQLAIESTGEPIWPDWDLA